MSALALRGEFRVIRTLALSALAVLALCSCGKSDLSTVAENMSATEAAADAPAPTTAPPSGLVPCPEVGRRLTQQDCDDLTGVAKNARAGVAAFNAPGTMVRGKPVVLALAVGLAQQDSAPAMDVAVDNAAMPDANETSEEMPGENGSNVIVANRPRPHPSFARPVAKPQTPEDVVGALPGKVVSYSPVTGRFMRATLTGAGFTIKPLTPASQEVFRDSQTVWQWEVTALQPDPHVLTLTTVVEGVTQDGTHFALRSTTRSQSVTVERTLWQKIWDAIDAMPGLLKAITAVVVALTALVAAIVGLRKAFGKADGGAPPPKP
jgi:hypothetical protein